MIITVTINVTYSHTISPIVLPDQNPWDSNRAYVLQYGANSHRMWCSLVVLDE